MPGVADSAEPERRDFFISYTEADRRWAEWLAFLLEENGYTVALQSWDFLAGGNFVLDMDKAAKHCDRTIAVLSPAYCESGFASSEWAAAFQRDPDGRQGALIPIRVEEFRPEGLFAAIVYIDLVGRSADEAEETVLGEIALRVEGGRRKPQAAPDFPGAPTPASAPFPGALPPVWNAPIRLRNFTGRDALLEQIDEALTGDRLAVLHGMGGIGKSRLAIEFAYRASAGYDVVWRVRARDEATARADLGDLAAALKLETAAEERQDAQVEAALAWLASHDRWLLIVDDATEPGAVAGLIPGGTHGHILVTTQAASGWDALGAPIAVDVLGEEDAVALLKSRGAGDEDELPRLAKALGYLPLALEQAAGYMQATGVGPAIYLARLDDQGSNPLDQGKPIDYEQTVATAWKLAMGEIEANQPALRLLATCAFLAPERIPRAIFEARPVDLPVDLQFEPSSFDAAIAELRRFSLIGLEGDRLAVHRLVQWAVRQGLADDMREGAQATALALLWAAWPEEDGRTPGTWPICAGLAPHIEALAELSSETELDVIPAQLLGRVAIYLYVRGDLQASIDTFRRAIDLLEQANGSVEVLLPILNYFGVALSYYRDHDQAVAVQDRVLDLIARSDLRGTTHAANSFCLAGISYSEAGDPGRSKELYETALEIFRREAPEDSHRIGSTLGNLGVVTRLLGEDEAARRLQEESLQMLEKEHGPEHLEVAISLVGLARQDALLGDLESAEQLQMRALGIFEQAYGPNCLEAARTHFDLGSVKASDGRLEEARDHFETGLAIHREKYGPDHRILQQPFVLLADLLRELGDEEAAARADRESKRLGDL